MKINVSGIIADIGGKMPFKLTVTPEDLLLTDRQLVVLGDILIKGCIINNGRLLEVRGSVEAVTRTVCYRCLQEFELPVEAEFVEAFCQTAADDVRQEDVSCFEGEEIDIADAVRDTILLAQPLQSLCHKDCKGLCPICGTDLNVHTCNCINENLDPRLAVLKNLLK